MIKIYKIVNDINDKVYVGQTSLTLKERWRYHLKDATNKRFKHRPLYKDMNQYGHKHFFILLIEEVDEKDRYQREVFWINQLHSFENGYNRTYGGQGKPYINYQLLYNKWYNSNKTMAEIAHEEGCSIDSVRLALSKYNVSQPDITKRGLLKATQAGMAVAQINLNNTEIINIFPSLRSVKSAGFCDRHVTEVCKHRIRKTHRGYKWAFVSELEETNPDLLEKYYKSCENSLDK